MTTLILAAALAVGPVPVDPSNRPQQGVTAQQAAEWLIYWFWFWL